MAPKPVPYYFPIVPAISRCAHSTFLSTKFYKKAAACEAAPEGFPAELVMSAHLLLIISLCYYVIGILKKF